MWGSVGDETHVLSHYHIFPTTYAKSVSALKLRTSGQIFAGTLRIKSRLPYQIPDSFICVDVSALIKELNRRSGVRENTINQGTVRLYVSGLFKLRNITVSLPPGVSQ